MNDIDRKIHDHDIAERVAQAIADIGNPNKPRAMYQPPKLSEHDAELQHRQAMAQRLK